MRMASGGPAASMTAAFIALGMAEIIAIASRSS
jgi:hypothetical protein